MDNCKNKIQSNILVVEDSIIATKAISNILAEMDCHIDVAPQGQEALELATNNRYDLIFMDIGLPDVNGFDLTKNIRAHESNNKNTPIVALTAYLDESTKINCINVGMNSIVTKPLSEEQAEEILNTLIPHRKLSSPVDDFAASVKREKYAALPLFDFSAAINHFGNETLAIEMITLLAKSLPEIRETLKAAYEINDWDNVLKIIRKLEGEASYCGLKRLHQVCGDFESAIKANNNDSYEYLYSWIFQIVYASLKEIEAGVLIKK